MEDHPDPAKSPAYHVVFGLPLGVIGFIGAVVWYNRISANVEESTTGLAPAYIGPVILGFFAILTIIWAILGLIVMITDWRRE